MVKTNFTLDGSSIDQGPVVADTISVAGRTSILQKMPFYYLPTGTPTDTATVPSLPSAPTNWSGALDLNERKRGGPLIVCCTSSALV